MTRTATVPQRGVLASFALLLVSMMLSGQASAFDVDGFSYNVINATDVEVTGRASGNTATDIVIPDTASDGSTSYSVTSIGVNAFLKIFLASVTIPDSVTSIGDSAFAVNALTHVTIPDSVTSIGVNAFSGNFLASVTIPDSVTSIGVNAFAGNGLTSVTIPDSVTSIEAYTFASNALASVTIPKTVETIGYGSFGGNRLTSVTIPDSVTSIGDYAFFRNVLTSVAFLGDFGAFSLDIFTLNEDLASITYCQGAAGWPQTFTPAGRIDNIAAEEVDCAAPAPAPAATAVPVSPLWLLVVMAGLLPLVGIRKLRKA